MSVSVEAGAFLNVLGAGSLNAGSTLGNVARYGLPRALTGPVRRGDVSVVRRHLEALERARPELVEAYREGTALVLRAAWIPTLVSFAIGALLGAAFLEVIPHAFEHGEPHTVAGSILGGILAFFLVYAIAFTWAFDRVFGLPASARPPED